MHDVARREVRLQLHGHLEHLEQVWPQHLHRVGNLVHQQRVSPLAHVRPAHLVFAHPLQMDVGLALAAHHPDFLPLQEAVDYLPGLVRVALPVLPHVQEDLLRQRGVHGHLEQAEDVLGEALVLPLVVVERAAGDEPPVALQPLERLRPQLHSPRQHHDHQRLGVAVVPLLPLDRLPPDLHRPPRLVHQLPVRARPVVLPAGRALHSPNSDDGAVLGAGVAEHHRDLHGQLDQRQHQLVQRRVQPQPAHLKVGQRLVVHPRVDLEQPLRHRRCEHLVVQGELDLHLLEDLVEKLLHRVQAVQVVHRARGGVDGQQLLPRHQPAQRVLRQRHLARALRPLNDDHAVVL
mmetsp:Transcript_7782/g.15918  ORF Transcript_7782/g.15918 Transcript_7782/m.15918 type:complete len:347 (+) Transcript_7782:713-1753(+)